MSTADPEPVDHLASLGPLFAVHTHSASEPVTEPWRPMNELVTDPAVLRERVAGVRAYLAEAGGRTPDAVPLRVAASVTQLGLVARLVSPALALALSTGRVLDLDLPRVRWQPVLGNGFPLSVPGNLDDPEPAGLAAALARRVLDGPVREITEATRPYGVSTRILWGNVASAVNGAASMIERTEERCHGLISALLSLPPLRDTSTRAPDGAFRRRSCCLIYQAVPTSSGAVCGDCVLLDRHGT